MPLIVFMQRLAVNLSVVMYPKSENDAANKAASHQSISGEERSCVNCHSLDTFGIYDDVDLPVSREEKQKNDKNIIKKYASTFGCNGTDSDYFLLLFLLVITFVFTFYAMIEMLLNEDKEKSPPPVLYESVTPPPNTSLAPSSSSPLEGTVSPENNSTMTIFSDAALRQSVEVFSHALYKVSWKNTIFSLTLTQSITSGLFFTEDNRAQLSCSVSFCPSTAVHIAVWSLCAAFAAGNGVVRHGP